MISRNYSIKREVSIFYWLNPRERIGFAELSRFAGSVLRCSLRRASILSVESLFIKEIDFH
jgi:hypothetical protein